MWFYFGLLFGSRVVQWLVICPSAESSDPIPFACRISPAEVSLSKTLNLYLLQGCRWVADPAVWPSCGGGCSKTWNSTHLGSAEYLKKRSCDCLNLTGTQWIVPFLTNRTDLAPRQEKPFKASRFAPASGLSMITQESWSEMHLHKKCSGLYLVIISRNMIWLVWLEPNVPSVPISPLIGSETNVADPSGRFIGAAGCLWHRCSTLPASEPARCFSSCRHGNGKTQWLF